MAIKLYFSLWNKYISDNFFRQFFWNGITESKIINAFNASDTYYKLTSKCSINFHSHQQYTRPFIIPLKTGYYQLFINNFLMTKFKFYNKPESLEKKTLILYLLQLIFLNSFNRKRLAIMEVGKNHGNGCQSFAL